MQFIVPFSMERISREVEAFDFLIGDFDAFGIGASIQLGKDLQSSLCPGCGNQAHHDFETDEWLSTPVLGDAGKEPMLDLIPLAGAWWKVAHSDAQADFISKLLQFQFPKPHT